MVFQLEKRPEKPRTRDEKQIIQLVTNLFRLKFCNDEDKYKQFRKYNVEIGELKRKPPPRGGGRHPPGPNQQNYRVESLPTPFKTREERRVAFWFIVSRKPDVFKNVFNIIYDDFKFFWAADPIRPPGCQNPDMEMIDYETSMPIPSELLWPEKPEDLTKDKEKKIYIKVTSSVIEDGTPLRVMLGATKGFSSTDREGTEATTFGKALLMQKFRFPIDVCDSDSIPFTKRDRNDFLDLFRGMANAFATYKNSVYKVPQNLEKYPGYKEAIAPGVHAWIGLYASLKHMQDYHPVINFGLVNQLFRDLNMNLIMFYLKVVNEFTKLTDEQLEEEIKQKRLGMNIEQRRKFSETMKGIKVKGKPVMVSFKYKNERTGRIETRWDPVTRHYKFLGLVERNPFTESPNEPPPAYGHQAGGQQRPPRRLKTDWEIEYAVFGFTPNTLKVPYYDEGKLRDITLTELYFRYGHELNFPDLPLGQVQLANRMSLVPVEMLFTHDTPQAYTKMLSWEMKHRFLRVCTRPAVTHQQFTGNLMRQMHFANPDDSHREKAMDPFLAEFETYIDPKNVECEGQILLPPLIKSEDGDLAPLEDPHRGFSLRKFLEVPPTNVYFSVLVMWDSKPTTSEGLGADVIESVQPELDIKTFFKGLVKVCRERGIQVSKKPLIWMDWKVNTEEYQKELPLAIRNMKKTFEEKQEEDPGSQMIILVVSRRKLDLYGYMKAQLNAEGMISQVIDCYTIQKAVHNREDGIYWHISMKINAKLGGVTHALSAAEGVGEERERIGDQTLGFLKEPTIFLGIDVTHPTSGCGYEGLSIASIVANYDIYATRYSCEIIPQRAAKETIINFDDNRFAATIRKFVEHTGQQPKHLVILRDGVSDAELTKTASVELMWIKALENHFSQLTITLTYVCVQKRHLVRIYPKEKKDAVGDAGNVPAGTLVDSVIVHPELYDFYLASHYGQIGTTRPARYIVLYDEWKLGVDHMQDMMYNLCYLYSRCSHPVSLPTPLYYAHLVCEQAKEIYKGLVRFDLLPTRDEEYLKRATFDDEYRQMDMIQRQLNCRGPGMHWV